MAQVDKTLDEARVMMLHELERSFREGDGWPVEADHDLNDAHRALVDAMAKAHGGECWLGRINLYGAERHGASPYLWKWDGTLVRNFSCAFAVPRHDAELERLIRERDDAPYITTAADAVRVDAIFDRITALGGHHLFWT